MAKVIDMNPERAEEATTPMVVGDSAIWYPEKPVAPARLRRDLRTLRFLLEEDQARALVCGPGQWALNQMTDEVEYGSRELGRRPLAPEDYTNIRIELERQWSHDGKPLQFAEGDVRAVARTVAKRHAYSPVQDYLKSVRHNGDPIGELGKALGLDEQKNGLELEFLKRWLIAAVARAFEPGCQVDSMLVFQGREGQFKSRFFEELGGKWFVRMSAELGSKDSVETMRRGWIIELDEMDAVKKTKEFSTVKAFITRPYDQYVPKWVRESVTVPRRSIFGGTVNDYEFLVDEDGNRRFWIIALQQQVDRVWVRENRDAIWAQAYGYYLTKEQWHLEAESEQLRREHNEQFIQRHPWVDLVEGYLAEQHFVDFITTQELYEKALGALAPSQQNGGTHKVLANILRRLGWYRAVQGPNNGRIRGWKRPVLDGR